MATDVGNFGVHRALADASRVRILEELRQGPLDVPALADRIGLHPNTIRSHLDVLSEAGLVSSAPERRARPGRPRIVYQLLEGGQMPTEGGYRLLAKILTSYLAGVSPEPARAAEAAGTAWGRYLADRPQPFAKLSPDDAAAETVKFLSDLGFLPEAAEVAGERRILLHRCPFRDAVDTNQEVVCAVHLGLLKGALQEMGAPLEATKLEPLVTASLCVAHLAVTKQAAEPDD